MSLGAAVPTTLYRNIPAPALDYVGGSMLGTSVATNGSINVVGAPKDQTPRTESGVVKIFDAATGALLQVWQNPSPDDGDHFGAAVAISGNLVVVGAPLDGSTEYRAGRAYVFDLNSATPTVPVLTLENPAPAMSRGYAKFGGSVAISGNRVLIGAPEDRQVELGSGKAYLFDLLAANPALPAITFENPTPNNGDAFGTAVAVSGTRVIIGAPFDDNGGQNCGAAYYYNVANASPEVPVRRLECMENFDFGQFGGSASIDGHTAVVGLPNGAQAHVFNLDSGSPFATVILPDPVGGNNGKFSTAVSISGQRVLVGAPTADVAGNIAGVVYAYDLQAADPTVPFASIPNPGANFSGSFGFAAVLSGNKAIIGDPEAFLPDGTIGVGEAGVAYVYDVAPHAPAAPPVTLDTPAVMVKDPTPVSSQNFGVVAISGTRVVVGDLSGALAPEYSGRAYVYDTASEHSDIPVVVLENPTPEKSDGFGVAVAMRGSIVAVGAPNDKANGVQTGSVYVYDVAGENPAVPMLTLHNPSGFEAAGFGESIAISGSRIVVGTPGNSDGANHGSVYIYDLTAAAPATPVVTLRTPAVGGSMFGRSVAIDGARVIAGMPYATQGGTVGAGCAFAYDLASATPTTPLLLTNPAPKQDGRLGSAVAVSGNRVVVGELSFDFADSGHAYVYALAGANPGTAVTALSHPNPGVNSHFGAELALSGSRLLAGCSGGGVQEAYFFDLDAADPTVPIGTLANPNADSGDGFGVSIALDRGLAVAACPHGNGYHFGRSSVLVFSAAPGTPPSMALTGAAPLTFEASLIYWDPGASALDRHNQPLTPNITANTVLAHVPGTYEVTWTATDAENVSGSITRTVQVVDTTAPVVSPPANVAQLNNDGLGAIVHYPAATATDVVGVASISYSQESDTKFPIGVTTVTVSAQDAAGNVGTATFTVSVLPGGLDKKAPSVAIWNPTAHAVGADFALNGVVKDDVVLKSFTVKLNGVPIALDAPLAFFAKMEVPWSVSHVRPENGPNLIEVEAIDLAGHTVRARKTVTFTNQRPALSGVFRALLRPSSGATNDQVGVVTVSVTKTGSFTGKFTMHGKNVRFSGLLDNDGHAHFKPNGQESLPIPGASRQAAPAGYLAFAVVDSTGLHASFSTEPGGTALTEGGSQPSRFNANAAVALGLLNTPGAHPTKGVFNLAFQRAVVFPGGVDYPYGYSCASILLTKTGHVVLAGNLADGTKFSTFAELRSDRSVSIFVPLYHGEGSIGGELSFIGSADTDVSGSDWLWFRPAHPGSLTFSSGWAPLTLEAFGTAYVQPAAIDYGQMFTEPVRANTIITLSYGGLPVSIYKYVRVDPITAAVRKITPASDGAYSFQLTPGTGIYSGTFLHPNGSIAKYRGVLLTKGIYQGGFGYFLQSLPPGLTQGGAATFRSAF